MMDKLVVAALLVAGLSTSHWHAFNSGKASCVEKVKALASKQALEDSQALTRLVQADAKREANDAAKIIRVKQVVGHCIDQRMPADIIDVLGGVQPAGGREPKSRSTEILSAPVPPG